MWQRDPETQRLIRIANMAEENPDVQERIRQLEQLLANQTAANQNNAEAEVPLRTTYMPMREVAQSAIVLPADANQFQIRPQILSTLPTYFGLENENPYQHIRAFEEKCSICMDDKVNPESVYLKLFTFSLRDKAKNWLIALKPASISCWNDLKKEFLTKFFGISRTYALRGQIMGYRQKPNESYDQTWERFKDLLLACPHHGYEKGRIIGFFYDGMLPQTKQFIDMMCGGGFFNKTQTQAWDFLEEITEHTRRWESTNEFDRSEQPLAATRGMHQLKPEDDVAARVTAEVAKAIKDMNIQQAKSVEAQQWCALCEAQGHDTGSCFALPAIKESLRNPAAEVNWVSNPNRGMNSNTYNPGWQKHPNLSWGPQSQQVQQPIVPYVPPPYKINNKLEDNMFQWRCFSNS